MKEAVRPAQRSLGRSSSFVPDTPSWGGRVVELRNRLLGSERFRAWAARFPLTRPLARRRAAEIFDLCAGYVYSQVLVACVELGVLEALHGGPRTLADLAERLQVPPDRLSRLLEAAESLGLVEGGESRVYALGTSGAVVAAQPALLEMIRHQRELYEDLRDLAGLVRAGMQPTRLSSYWAYAGRGQHADHVAASAATYSALMSATRELVTGEIFRAYDLSRHHWMMDVGGGEGMFAAEACRRFTMLRASVFDLPPVAARARSRQSDGALVGRFDAIGGDFRSDTLPVGADLITFVRVVHDHDDDVAVALLSAAFRALPPGGTVLVAEPMCESGAAGRVGHAYFNLYFLAMGTGRARSAKEVGRLLERAGFSAVQRHATTQPVCVSVVSARKPGKTMSR